MVEVHLQTYNIPQIEIHPYNKHSTGIVEQGHFTIWEGILRSCQGKFKDWPKKVRLVFFADKVTTRRSTGFSPFYLLYGTHPILPFDLAEATFMISSYRAGLSTAELLALRICQLEKHPKDIQRASDAIRRSRLASKAQFEKRFSHRLRQTPFNLRHNDKACP